MEQPSKKYVFRTLLIALLLTITVVGVLFLTPTQFKELEEGIIPLYNDAIPLVENA